MPGFGLSRWGLEVWAGAEGLGRVVPICGLAEDAAGWGLPVLGSVLRMTIGAGV